MDPATLLILVAILKVLLPIVIEHGPELLDALR